MRSNRPKMDIVLLAAGRGTRMKEYTAEKTKAMLVLPQEGKPMLQVTVENCIALGSTRFIIVVGYRKEDVMQHQPFLDLEKQGLAQFIFVEQENHSGGTADAVETALPHVVSNQFLCIFSDVVATVKQLKSLVAASDGANNKDSAVMAVRTVPNPERYGVVETRPVGDLLLMTRITEKSPEPQSNLINAGVYVFPESIAPFVKATGKSARGERELTDSMQNFVDAGHDMVLVNVNLLDVGTKEEYQQLCK